MDGGAGLSSPLLNDRHPLFNNLKTYSAVPVATGCCGLIECPRCQGRGSRYGSWFACAHGYPVCGWLPHRVRGRPYKGFFGRLFFGSVMFFVAIVRVFLTRACSLPMVMGCLTNILLSGG